MTIVEVMCEQLEAPTLYLTPFKGRDAIALSRASHNPHLHRLMFSSLSRKSTGSGCVGLSTAVKKTTDLEQRLIGYSQHCCCEESQQALF